MPLETDRRSWLGQKYIEDIEFAHEVRMVTALAFLPHERIKTAAAQLNIYGAMTSMLKNEIFFSIFFRYFFDIISIFFSMFSMFFSIFSFD